MFVCVQVHICVHACGSQRTTVCVLLGVIHPSILPSLFIYLFILLNEPDNLRPISGAHIKVKGQNRMPEIVF